MRIPTPFGPIAVGEIDWRIFDFTADCNGDPAVSTQWFLSIPASQPGTDDSPQSRILSVSVQTQLTILAPDGTQTIRTGVFSQAVLGTFPASAIGASYLARALVTTQSGRILSLEAMLPCVDG